MAHVSRAQIERAKEVGIEEYILNHEPSNFKRIGRAMYLKDHDSLRISNGFWKWESRGIGGKNALDFLVKVRGYEFSEAVLSLTGRYEIKPVLPKSKPPIKEPSEVKKERFLLPRRHDNNDRVIEYLMSRGIAKSVILDCINNGSLYESAKYHNCVFVGRDGRGKARFAAQRGTIGDFKCDVERSEKQYGFLLPPTDKIRNTCIIFESPIDALSHKMLSPETDGFRVSLGGTSLAALSHFLKNHAKTERIIVCTDNDEAGNFVAEKAAKMSACKVARQVPPNGAKDWNEALLSIRKVVTIMEDKRKDILFLNEPFTCPEKFRIKDGDSVKVTFAYDGRAESQKCRYIDETHLTIGGNTYHISELAERLQKNGNKIEPIPDQQPMLNILAAQYGEKLQNIEIPMTEKSIKSLVGEKYTQDKVRGDHLLLCGQKGAAIVKDEDGAFAPVHPYWAQTLQKEIVSIDNPYEKSDKKPSLMGKLESGKEKSAEQKTQNKSMPLAETR